MSDSTDLELLEGTGIDVDDSSTQDSDAISDGEGVDDGDTAGADENGDTPGAADDAGDGDDLLGDSSVDDTGDADADDAPKPKAEDYKLDLPAGQAVDEEFLASYREVAASQGLTQEQFSAIVTVYADRVKATLDDQQKVQLENRAKIRADKESFVNAQKAAKWAVEKHPELKEFFKGPAGDHPPFVSFLASLGSLLGEDGFVGESNGSRERRVEDTLFSDMFD